MIACEGPVPSVPPVPRDIDNCVAGSLSHASNDEAKELATCFVRFGRLGYGTFDMLHRYETALWRQAAQILSMLRSIRR